MSSLLPQPASTSAAETESEPLLNPASGEADSEAGVSGGDATTNRVDQPNGQSMDGTSWRIATAAFSFVVLGLFTSTTGATIPHLQEYYQLTDIRVSAFFLVIPVGYTIASWLNDSIHAKLGQRGVATIGPVCHLVYAVTASTRPPFPVFLVGAGVGAFGIGLLDGSWCAWFAALEKANTLSGLLHGSFSTGAAICPYLVGIMLSAGSELWYRWFYVLAAVSVVEIVALSWAFRRQDAAKYHESKARELVSDGTVNQRDIFRYSATWIYAIYILAYVGTECMISGWIVSFMLRVRNASTYASSLCSSAFWAGMAAGRLMLGIVTDKLGVKRAVIIYLAIAPGVVVMFIMIHVLWFSALTMTLLGFIMGPLFPSCIVQLVELLPKELHVAVVSFVASLGQVGGALLPYMLGAITQVAGLQVFQYMLLVQFAVLLFLWIASFRLSGPKESAAGEVGQSREHED